MTEPKGMTIEEFLEKYGAEKVVFSSYYKYSFVFSNDKVWVSVGGTGDDIYRLEVNTKPITINALADYVNYWGTYKEADHDRT